LFVFNRIRASNAQHYVAVIRTCAPESSHNTRALASYFCLWRPNRCSRSSSQSLPWPCSRVRLSPLTHRPLRRPPSSPLPRPEPSQETQQESCQVCRVEDRYVERACQVTVTRLTQVTEARPKAGLCFWALRLPAGGAGACGFPQTGSNLLPWMGRTGRNTPSAGCRTTCRNEHDFPSCDQEDLIEAIDRVEEQLHVRHPNVALMCRF